MHWQALQFVTNVRHFLPHHFYRRSVLEIGSHDVNGSVRQAFLTDAYTGIDLSEGPGVDVVVSGHEFRSEDRFGTAISCECFEHNPFFAETLEVMIDHLSADGLVVFTCASEGRPEHGTSRTDAALSPGTSSLAWEYYRNLSAEDFDHAMLSTRLAGYRFFTNSVSQDLYFIGTVDRRLAEDLPAIGDKLATLVDAYEAVSVDPHEQPFDNNVLAMASEFEACPDLVFFLRQRLAGDPALHSPEWRELVADVAQHWPRSPKLAYVQADVLQAAGDYYGALRLIDPFARRHDCRPYLANQYGDLLANIDRYEDAIAALEGIEGFEAKPPLLRKAAQFGLLAGDAERSLGFIGRALDLEPENDATAAQHKRTLVAIGRTN